MRITVLDFDTFDDGAAALAAISAALTPRTNGVVAPDASRLVTSEQSRGLPTLEPALIERAPAPAEEHRRLSPALFEAWQFLVAQDNPDGVRAEQLVEGLHLKMTAATWRLGQLVNKGLARRVKPGRYRAGEAS